MNPIVKVLISSLRLIFNLIISVFISAIIFHCNCIAQCTITINTFPYHEDFETSQGGWNSGGTNDDWAWGTPAKPVISSAASGLKCWITGGLISSFYNLGEASCVESPCFDFSALSNPYITFKIFWETEKQYDGANLQYSINGGTSWTNVGGYGGAIDCKNDNWYNISSINYLASLASVKSGWSGNIQPSSGSCGGGGGSNGWKIAKQSMPYLAGKPQVIFRFTFGAGNLCNDYDGFAFDDITIEESSPALTLNYSAKPSGCTNPDGSLNFNVTGGDAPYAYQWTPNVSSSSAASGLSAGTYTVTVTDNAGCTKSVSANISQSPPPDFKVLVNPDTCSQGKGSARVQMVSGVPPFLYNWAPFTSAASSIQQLMTGAYTVTVTDSEGCSTAQNYMVDNSGDFSIHIGSDTSICGTDGFILYAGSYAVYTWQDSSHNSVYHVDEPGIYFVTVINNSGCPASDTINVVEDCLNDVIVPSAFTPNDDGINEVFKAETVSVRSFNMQVFNRYGEKIFESNDINTGWNGTYRNKLSPEGVYAWRIKFSKDDSHFNFKIGTMVLIR